MDDPRASVDPAISSEGQRLLLEVRGSLAEIAAAVGVSKQIVSYWRRGEKSPSASARAKVHELYGIEPAAWDRVPTGAAPAAPAAARGDRPPAAAVPGARAATLDEVENLLAWLGRQRNDPSLKQSERVRFADAETKALALRARLEEKREMLEARTVDEHPRFVAVLGAITAALKPFPDATRAVIAALEVLPP